MSPKGYCRITLRKILKILTEWTLRKHDPQIIALVGQKGTTIARETLYTILHQNYPTRRSIEAPEAEFVIPLTVFGTEYYPKNIFEWLKVIVKTILQLIFLEKHSNILILEMTTKRTEILDYWLEITKPDLVITCGNHPPSHYFNQETAVSLNVDKQPSLQPYMDLAVKAGEKFGLDKQEVKQSLENFSLPEARIRLHPGKKGGLVVDATYNYFPPSRQSLEEILESFTGRKVWIRSERDWEVKEIKEDDTIVIIGPRQKLASVTRKAVLQPFEAR